MDVKTQVMFIKRMAKCIKTLKGSSNEEEQAASEQELVQVLSELGIHYTKKADGNSELNFKIMLNWAEGQTEENIEFASLDELQKWFLNHYPQEKLDSMGGYLKHSLSFYITNAKTRHFIDKSEDCRIYVSKNKGDFNPNKQHIAEYSFLSTWLKDKGVKANIDYTPSLISLGDGGKSLPNESQDIDLTTLPKTLDDFKQDGASNFEAARNYFHAYLQGKAVNTAIGKVHLLGSTWREMKKGMSKDDIKAALIPFVPEILTGGKYDGREDLKKNPTNKAYVAFHAFSKTGILIDNKEIEARVLVGERNDGQYEFVAYSLHHNNGVMDTTNPTSWSQGNARGLVGSDDGINAMSRTVHENENDVNGVFDNIADGEDGWNIEIVSIREIGTGDNQTNSLNNDEESKIRQELSEQLIIEKQKEIVKVSERIKRLKRELRKDPNNSDKANKIALEEKNRRMLRSRIFEVEDAIISYVVDGEISRKELENAVGQSFADRVDALLKEKGINDERKKKVIQALINNHKGWERSDFEPELTAQFTKTDYATMQRISYYAAFTSNPNSSVLAFKERGVTIKEKDVGILLQNGDYDLIAEMIESWRKEYLERKQLAPELVAPDENQSTAETSKTFGSQVAEPNHTPNSENQQDLDYLQAIIDGKVDVLADGFEDELIPIVERLGEEHEMVSKAVEVYSKVIEQYASDI